MSADRRFEDLCLLVEAASGEGVYPMGHLTADQKASIKAAGSDEYKVGWNDRSMAEYDREKSLMRLAEAGIDDDLRLLLASGCAFGRPGGVALNMNDTWAWACSDIPEVPADQVTEVARLFRKYGFAGLMYWYTTQPGGPARSEFADNNRAIDFVRHEEQIRKDVPESNKRAYHKVTYTLGE
jgi:hypothetical protein